MELQKFCNDCSGRQDCRKVYQQLGEVKGPSVFMAIIAFLVPLVVFIFSFAFFSRMVAEVIDSAKLKTAFSFLLSLLVTIGLMLTIKVINRQLGKSRQFK